MGIGIYKLGLRRSIRETLSDIYYRIYFCDVIASGVHQLQGKIAVQVDGKRDARSFWWGGKVVGFAGLTKQNYKPTTCGIRIGCRQKHPT
jgi:hypothetical protein